MNTTDLATALAEAHNLDPALAQRIAGNYAAAARRGSYPGLLDAGGNFTAAAVERIVAEVGASRTFLAELDR